MYTARASNIGAYDLGDRTDLPKKNLGKEDFLKLLVAQLKNMDIGKEGSNQEFIAQMAQFSTLEELQNLNAGFRDMTTMQLIGEAGALIGKTIEALPPGYDVHVTGKVESVQIIGGMPYLAVGDMRISLGHVTKIS